MPSRTPGSPRRREALGAFGAALSTAPLMGLAASAPAGPGPSAWAEQFDDADWAAARGCALIPQETAGPYPLLKVLGDDRYVRSDITEGRLGVAVALTIKLVDINNSCAPLSNAAVYIWHTDKDALYSGYKLPDGQDTRGETFMRGVQLTNNKGNAHFVTVFPGWYPGRITHIHFQIYLNNDTGKPATATSQLAFPQAVTKAVYDSPLYAERGQNTTVRNIKNDGVFSDGFKLQLVKMQGSVDTGYEAKLLVGVAG